MYKRHLYPIWYLLNFKNLPLPYLFFFFVKEYECFIFEVALATIFTRKLLRLKVEKKIDLLLNMSFCNKTPLILKQFIRNTAKSEYQYVFVCKQINMFVEWMSKYSKFIVNVEHYCMPDEKNCCLFFMYVSLEWRKIF